MTWRGHLVEVGIALAMIAGAVFVSSLLPALFGVPRWWSAALTIAILLIALTAWALASARMGTPVHSTAVAARRRKTIEVAVNGLTAVFLLGFAASFSVNSFDEALDPEIAAFDSRTTLRLDADDNAYFALMGFTAPVVQNPYAFGRKIVGDYEKALAEKPGRLRFESPPDSTIKIDGAPWELCRYPGESCLERYLAEHDRIAPLLEKNGLLVERTKALYAFTRFDDSITPSAGAPLWSFHGDHVALFLQQVILELRRGNTTQALDALERHLTFWRMTLRESSQMISGQVASIYLQRGARLFSEILAKDPTIAGKHEAQVLRMAEPLRPSETNLAPKLGWDFGQYRRTYEFPFATDAGDRHFWWLPADRGDSLHYYHPRATINQLYRAFKPYADHARAPATRFVQLRSELPPSPPAETLSIANFYNPIGKAMGTPRFSDPADSDRIARIHDLDGYFRLIALQVEILRQGIADAELSDFVRKAGPRYANPYTGEPMRWDLEKRTLSFTGQSERFSRISETSIKIN